MVLFIYKIKFGIFFFILILGTIESKRFKVLLTGGRLIKVLIYHLIGARTRGASNSCPIRQFSNRADTCKNLACVARVVGALKGSLGGGVSPRPSTPDPV